MNDLEARLRQFPTLDTPPDLWKRIRERKTPRRPIFRDALMVSAAAGLLAWLGYALLWTPDQSPSGRQDRDEWLDKEPALGDVSPPDRAVIEALLADLGAGQPSRREAALRLLEERLETAIPYLREAARSENPELRASAARLVALWEKSREAISLRALLADVRKESKPKEEWRPILKRAIAGSAPDVEEVRKIGWVAAPLLVEMGAQSSGVEQLRTRILVKELLLPRFYPRRTTRLLRRKHGDGYEGSAYSFRHESADPEACKNMMDIIFNNCGLLHFTPYGDTQSFVVDAGKCSWDQVTDQPKGSSRRANCLLPEEGHVYILEIREGGEIFSYKFRIQSLSEDAIDLEWSGMGDPKKVPPISPLQGKAGLFNSCGGRHSEY